MAEATALMYASTSYLRKSLGFEGKAEEVLCKSGRKLHCGTLSPVGWTDAALWGPVDGRPVPIGLCGRFGFIGVDWAAPRFAMGIQIRQEAEKKHPGR